MHKNLFIDHLSAGEKKIRQNLLNKLYLMNNLSTASFELSHGRSAVELWHEHLSSGRDAKQGCLE